ncbi:MAG: class I SAM-dependent methyltransferase [Proteobacteria bacterium]|nr:class I SAM-dependent methyltransferase [Pseudomonadota bacterium]
MILNRIEKFLMNNPVRAAFQMHLEARRLMALGGPMGGGRALEVGCGRGVGCRIVLDVFGAGQVTGMDLDPDMVRRAGERLAGYGDRVRLYAGDVTDIPEEDASFDAVFDFGILHHVPDWQKALSEVFRVLKPGGRFYAEEALEKFIRFAPIRWTLDHPMENRFGHRDFIRGMEKAGFRVLDNRPTVGEWFGWYFAEKPGAGVRGKTER